MTFQELQNEVILFRFREGQRSSVKSWLNHRYAMMWAAAEWPFRQAPPTSFTVTGGSQSVSAAALPADLLRPVSVFDDVGLPLQYREPKEFFRQNTATTVGSGSGVQYTFVDGALYIAPTPSGSGTYKVQYQRKFGRLVSGTTQTAGLMSADTDVPSAPLQFHYMLTLGASATGLKLENDLTYGAVEEEFQQMLQVMRAELLPMPENTQYGIDYPEI